MSKKKIFSSLLLILVAILWGCSFVAQSSGGNLIGPFSFGFVRFFLAGIAQWWNMVNQWVVWAPLLYSAIFAGAVAFTLQIVAQKNVNPTLASLLMSLESVFSVLAGWLILGDKLSARELIGCVVIFIALVIAQIPAKEIIRAKKS